MQRNFQIVLTLGWFLLAAFLGALLRWHQVSSIEGFVYPRWLHAHSHIAFLGWLFNAFFLLLTAGLPAQEARSSGRLFAWIQLPLVGMAISFPVSGYSLLSILFSTFHILLAWYFSWKWWRCWQKYLDGPWLSTARVAIY